MDLWEIVKDREAWHASVHGVEKSWTWLSDWTTTGLPWCLSGKETTCNAGDTCSIPGSERSPEGGHDNPFQYTFLENPMDRGPWQASVHRVAKSWTWLKDWACMHTCRHSREDIKWDWYIYSTIRKTECWNSIYIDSRYSVIMNLIIMSQNYLF